ncbi:hypothetical protein L3Q82_018923, partial [Scortum barcoo]
PINKFLGLKRATSTFEKPYYYSFISSLEEHKANTSCCSVPPPQAHTLNFYLNFQSSCTKFTTVHSGHQTKVFYLYPCSSLETRGDRAFEVAAPRLLEQPP